MFSFIFKFDGLVCLRSLEEKQTAEDEKWVTAQSEAEGLVQSPGKVFVHLELFHIKSQPESVFIGILSDRPTKAAQCEGEVDLKNI